MASGPSWTPEEDSIMRTYYPTEHSKVAARLPGRSRKTIYARANMLGLSQKMETKPERWSEEELEILRKYYPAEGAAVVERLHNRTVPACRLQARALGIRYRDFWKESEDAILREHFATEGAAVAARFPNRSEAVCLARARTLGLIQTSSSPSETTPAVPV